MFSVAARGLSAAPPARRTRQENHATLLVSWWCTGFALVIILLRVCGRFVRSERLFTEDKVMFWSIVPLLARMALVHVILLYGTNNTTIAGLTAQGVYERTIGSKLVLASRIFYALFIWAAKWSASLFLKRLTYATWNPMYERILRAIRIFLAVTFLGVVIGTLAECQPFDHYWQVVPDPGPRCRNGYAQLLTMGISDMITDLLLILFPIPIILQSHMAVRRKIGLSLMFMLSACLIAITAVRIVSILEVDGRQQRRSLWASIEILAASAVSNVIILGSFVRDRGTKKAKYRATVDETINSEGPSINRHMTLQHWGADSDEDLFRSIGSRLNSVGDVLSSEQNVQRAPAKATDTMRPYSPNGTALGPEPANSDNEKPARPEEELRPQAYSAFLRENDRPHSSPQRTGSRRSARAASLRRIRPLGVIATQDFGAVDWSGPLQPEELSLADAGGLLPAPLTPILPQSIVQRRLETPEVSPMSTRPRSTFPNLRRPDNVRTSLDTLPISSSPSMRVRNELRGSPVAHSAGRRSGSRQRPVTAGPDDLQLGDAGGLLS